jgi:MoxR-like ATPase
MDLITATRQPERYGEDLKKWIHIGASPRGGIGLDKCSRVHAWLSGKDYVTPDDVREVVHDVLRHRIMLSYEANAEGITSDQVIAAGASGATLTLSMLDQLIDAVKGGQTHHVADEPTLET